MHTLFRQLNALGLLAVSTIMAYALYDQLIANELPCPLCLIQRLGFSAVMLALMLNSLHGPKPVYYGFATLSAVFGGAAALRQVSLHVIPGTPGYGEPLWGLHFYTWAFICFVIMIIGFSVVSSFAGQYKTELMPRYAGFNKQPWLIKISCLIAILILLANTLLTFAECGPQVCPDNPLEYWLFN